MVASIANATVRTIKDRALAELSMLGGVDTQLYAEDKMARVIQRVYDNIFLMRFWYSTTNTFTVPLDVATGLPTVDMTDPTRCPSGQFRDIQFIWRESEIKELPLIPPTVNPAFIRVLGILPVADPTKIFKLAPAGEQNAVVRARQYPGAFTDDSTVVNFDEMCITMAVCAAIHASTGTNPAEEDDFRTAYLQRLDTLMKLEDNHDHYAGGYGSSFAADWQEYN